uniref:Solute carrier family 35 member B4 n=1 Tax=Sinocyclocheilus anshuiensis TaxID=1608454 RepID=A0A671K908_9TELE
MNTLFAIALVFVGCCSNVVFLELLVRMWEYCHICQFAFIALEGFIFETNFGRKKPHIPLRLIIYNIYTQIHFTYLHRISDMISGVNVEKGATEEDVFYAFMHWILGIAMLTFALLMSARMGIFQETLYKKYGKHSQEALFYNHCLPLPGFLLLSTDIYRHAVLFSQSSPVEIPVIGQSVPVMWLYLLMNVITQYVCIRGVFILTTECASLTVTLVVTLRKFLSLISSILYFHNPFTAWHWVGTAVVFLGTLLYTEVWSSIRAAMKGEKADKKAE